MTRRIVTRLGSLAAALACFALQASAQLPGTVEVGLFGQRTSFDEFTTLSFGTDPGIGGILGVYVVPNLLLEAGASFTWTETESPPSDASWTPFRIRVVYGFPVTENFYPIAGAGLVRNGYGGAVDDGDTGLNLLAGVKTYVRDRVAFRSEINFDYVSSPFNDGTVFAGSPVTSHLNWNLTAGISLDIGAGRFRDSDGDRVRDRIDLCPETPLGVGVDTVGCRLDADRDRVFDEDDLCPDTQRGVGVDTVGCRLDADRDRVFDEDDACPGTPLGVGVDTVGCRLDADRDRVFDEVDACPDTPLGVGVDAIGCRLDADADGVFNEDDDCPDTAPGVEVDDAGCQVLFAEEETILVLEGVTFETASANLAPEASETLDRVAASLLASPQVEVRVTGHTDSVGSRAYNVTLSQNRAESVVAYLVSRGVAPDRLSAQGFGPDQPVDTNATADGRQRNRRVELELVN